MPRLPFFTTVCPHCSRKNEIEITRLGRQAQCERCDVSFVAEDADGRSAALEDPIQYWIHFTEQGASESEASHGDREIYRTPR